MAASLNQIRFTKGRVFADPVSLQNPGTELGITRGRFYKPAHDQVHITKEAFGGVTSEIWHMQKSPVFICFLRTWDTEALARFFPDYSSGVVQANATGGARSGYKLSTKAFKFLFLADDPTHMSILIYRFIPFVDPEAQLGLSLREEFGVLIGGVGSPDIQGRLAAIGPAASLLI